MSDDWKIIERIIRVKRAKSKCERCGAANGTYELRDGKLIKIMLSVIHLDEDQQNNATTNLLAVCQDCRAFLENEAQRERDNQQAQLRLF